MAGCGEDSLMQAQLFRSSGLWHNLASVHLYLTNQHLSPRRTCTRDSYSNREHDLLCLDLLSSSRPLLLRYPCSYDASENNDRCRLRKMYRYVRDTFIVKRKSSIWWNDCTRSTDVARHTCNLRGFLHVYPSRLPRWYQELIWNIIKVCRWKS